MRESAAVRESAALAAGSGRGRAGQAFIKKVVHRSKYAQYPFSVAAYATRLAVPALLTAVYHYPPLSPHTPRRGIRPLYQRAASAAPTPVGAYVHAVNTEQTTVTLHLPTAHTSAPQR